MLSDFKVHPNLWQETSKKLHSLASESRFSALWIASAWPLAWLCLERSEPRSSLRILNCLDSATLAPTVGEIDAQHLQESNKLSAAASAFLNKTVPALDQKQWYGKFYGEFDMADLCNQRRTERVNNAPSRLGEEQTSS